MNSEDVVPPLAANMSAAFKKVRGAIGAADPELTDLIVTSVYDIGVHKIRREAARPLTGGWGVWGDLAAKGHLGGRPQVLVAALPLPVQCYRQKR
jgi:hypothetical protein